MEALSAQGVGVFGMDAEHLACLTELMPQYADLPRDLADVSLVLLAEEFGEGRMIRRMITLLGLPTSGLGHRKP